jgi:hypothetical protein
MPVETHFVEKTFPQNTPGGEPKVTYPPAVGTPVEVRNPHPYEHFRVPVTSSGNVGARSAQEAAAKARHSWVRIRPNPISGAYDIMVAVAALRPKWPRYHCDLLIRTAFRSRNADQVEAAHVRA